MATTSSTPDLPEAPPFDVRYAVRKDGARTAYGVVGSGLMLIYPPGLMSTLEWASSSPDGPAFIRGLAAHRTVVAFDRHGCGLSDRDRTDFSLTDDMQDFDAVVEAMGPGRFDIFTASWGPVLAVTFAALHPERVRRMVLFDASIRDDTVSSPRYTALMALLGTDREAFVQALTGLGFPEGTDEETLASVIHFLRTAASDDVLLGLCRAIPQVRHHLGSVQAPTLVLQRKGDRIVTPDNGELIAAGIPGARFVLLEGSEHVPWTGDWQAIVKHTNDFLLEGDRVGSAESVGPNVRRVGPRLTLREREILGLVASGKSNPQISAELGISVNTVQRHVSSILHKAELRNRAEAVAYAIRNGLA